MKLLAHILNRIAFVRAEISPDGACRTEVFLWCDNGFVSTDRSTAKCHLAAVILMGYGVVTRSAESEIADRIINNPEVFLWSIADRQISFVRRERMQSVLAEITKEGIMPVRFFCADAGADFAHVVDACVVEFYKWLRWRELVGLTREASAMAQAFVRRVALPALGTFLCLLAANAMLAPRLETRRQTLATEIALRERSASNASSTIMRHRELLTAFASRPRTLRAMLCDRIAGTIPERVVLTQFNVEPLTNRFEEGKPLQRLENSAVIIGAAPSASDISAFVQRLSELTCCREVRLANVEKIRECEGLTFRIEFIL